MLERFDGIKKVGLFHNYSHSPDCDLGEVTLIYGENGVGKSTLAAILDSLRERNAGEIVRRRSLPGDVIPTVNIGLNGKIYSFNGQDWDSQPPNDTLEVFYPGFVTRNVHAATAVDPEHRRNLCEFVLGRKAVVKVSRLAEADNEGRTALNEIKALDKQLQLIIKSPDTLETFPGLSNNAKVDEDIESVRAELKQARSKDAILARMIPKIVTLPDIERDAIAKLLNKSTDGIGANVSVVVREHIKQHLDSDGEKWLAYGSKHIGTDNKCPFCAQDVTSASFVAAIRSYFSEEYRAYIEQLLIGIQAIKDRLSTAVFQQLRTAFTGQIAVATQWVGEMPLDQIIIESTLSEAEVAWKSAAQKLGAILTGKQSKPLERLEVTVAEEALAEYERAIGILGTVNEILEKNGKKAQERKDALTKADIKEIEIRLHRFENQKARFEPLTQELLKKKNNLIERRGKLDSEKDGLKKEIDEHASRVIGKYQSGINHYLEHFGSDIRIESIESRFPSGKAIVQFTLKAHGHEIELGLSSDGPCFETVLSEGDKYTLALAFFLARLKEHSGLAGRIVVLDDPVNSLGSFRRTLVEGVIRDLRTRGAQVVVLTHDERLAAMMWRDKKLKSIVSLQVERTNKGSQLKPWDVDRATQTEYVENYLTICEFLENGGDHKPAAGCIRLYLEQRLRYLFPGPPFETRDTLGQMIDKIRKSPLGSRLCVLHERLSVLDSINEASLPDHHATDDVPGMAPLTPEGVRLFANKVLDVLK